MTSSMKFLRRDGLLNADAPDYGELASERLIPTAYCLSDKCCLLNLGVDLVYDSRVKRAVPKKRTQRVSMVKKTKIKITERDCPDCGHALQWKGKRDEER